MLCKCLLCLQRAAVVEVAEVMRISFVTGSPHGDDNRQLLTVSFLLQIGISPNKVNGAFPQVSEYFPNRCWIKSTCPVSWIHPYKPYRYLFICTPFKSKILGFPPPQPHSSLLPASHPTQCDLREHNSVLSSSVAWI